SQTCRAALSSECVPVTLVSRNASGPRIDRSTCDSAAKCTTVSRRSSRSRASTSCASRMSPWTDLIDDFFGVRKVIVGTIADVENVVQRQLQPFRDVLEKSRPFITPVASEPLEPPPTPLNGQILARSFAEASRSLLSWPTTLQTGGFR